jgi:hypothetical protein
MKNTKERDKERELEYKLACGIDPNPQPQPFDYDIRAAAKYVKDNNIQNGLTEEQLKMFIK